ncbi:I78 family peptidase inhibitor [Pseudomonas sp. RAC1]|uniref:I78 family peptidase inhibitor n=1 Tax=Pseudomonas sp. RAC1 TaxID=3064900 RepID=UPI00271AC257|nr:I78 family peptidase inhibitor [Pseudomonas sp. RAC1]MDV9033733.1 I78 family peptidase inhibitor [Pseudomonas sp. RAC1]
MFIEKTTGQAIETCGTAMTDTQVNEAMQSLIGKTYTDAIRDELKQTTGRPVTGPADIVTRELNPQRINLRTDAQGVISGVDFG